MKKKLPIIIMWVILILVLLLGNLLSEHVNTQRQDILDNVDISEYVEVTEISYNFDLETIGNKTYIVTFIYEEETYKIYVDHNFYYVETIEGHELDALYYSAVKIDIDRDDLIQNTAYITNYDSATNTVTITANGFDGLGSIVVDFIFDINNNIESYVVTSTETYDIEYNSGYNGDTVPAVENAFIDGYINSTQIPLFDSIAGASEGTGEAMVEILTLLNQFIDSIEGGN